MPIGVMKMKLTELQVNDTATVMSLHNLDKPYVQRLMDIGVYENAAITLVRRLSNGRLFLIEVDDIEICVRKDDADKIEVLK
jgi:ferrous iron transport protein A